MSQSRFYRTFAVLLVLLMPFGFFIYFEMNKKEPPKPAAVYGEVPYYKFENQYGDTITSDDMKGYIYVTDFFSIHSLPESNKLTTVLSGIQESYKTEVKVKVISFSLDSSRDSVTALNQYARQYKAIPNKWFFLRGENENVINLAKNGFKISLMPDSSGNVAYSPQLVIVDGKGQIRGYYDVTNQSAYIDSLYNNIERLLVEKPK